MTPRRGTGANTAERAPTTIGASPLAMRARSSRRSASVSDEWRIAIRSPKRARKRPTVALCRLRPLAARLPLHRRDERERAPRRRAVVLGDPERELDERPRQLFDDTLDL